MLHYQTVSDLRKLESPQNKKYLSLHSIAINTSRKNSRGKKSPRPKQILFTKSNADDGTMRAVSLEAAENSGQSLKDQKGANWVLVSSLNSFSVLSILSPASIRFHDIFILSVLQCIRCFDSLLSKGKNGSRPFSADGLAAREQRAAQKKPNSRDNELRRLFFALFFLLPALRSRGAWEK